MQSSDPEDHRPPMPDVYVDEGDPVEPGPFVTVEVDGERFAVGPDGRGGTRYSWLTGPNQDYGFSSDPARAYGYGESPTGERTADDHRASIRAFLSHLNPQTGYLD